ncbi:MAG: hypothetical protein LBS52_00545 [Dysgonamonadaceae bacterium]|jgi:hypothetical protein|nr:hypothetical protein [Dysgonamonadaceae bacterium]
MRFKPLFFSFLSLSVFCSFPTQAQEDNRDSTKYPLFKFDGTLKNKFEYATELGRHRFSVRNSRLGVSGKITPLADYRVQLELSSEGKFQVLDLSGTLAPCEGLSLTLGQTSIPIFNSYVTNPGTMLFANRTFLAKYYAGTRDIGLLAKYSYNELPFPICAELGIFNGNVINAPVWTHKFSFSARLGFGAMKGFRSTLKVYGYPKSDTEDYLLYGADARYEGDNWKVETEIMRRDDNINRADLTSGYLQGAYCFPLKCKLFKNIVPAVRWDAINQIKDKELDVSRITTGLGFGLSEKKFSSLLRVDYEWYFVNNELSFLQDTQEMNANKLTVELVYVF